MRNGPSVMRNGTRSPLPTRADHTPVGPHTSIDVSDRIESPEGLGFAGGLANAGSQSSMRPALGNAAG